MSTISQAHSNAARVNGAMSHGPVTPEGKARSSQNARTHGFTSQRLFLAEQDKPEFDQLRARLLSEFTPKGDAELLVFDELILAAWKLRNISLRETTLGEQTGEDLIFSTVPELMKLADRLQRYRTANERAFHRAIAELRRLQNDRLYREQFPNQLPKDAPKLANAQAFTHRTQALLKTQVKDAVKQAEEETKLFNSQIQEMLNQMRK
ncbi:MAG: hypothetical protein IT166_10920 [Bryobacterales bacterium]|nr:hypothetical protein [Bryobacterales bacterium]